MDKKRWRKKAWAEFCCRVKYQGVLLYERKEIVGNYIKASKKNANISEMRNDFQRRPVLARPGEQGDCLAAAERVVSFRRRLQQPPANRLQSTASSQLPPVNQVQSTASSQLPSVNRIQLAALTLQLQ